MHKFDILFPDGARAVMSIFAGVWLCILGASLILYLLKAYGIYKIAKRLDIESPWIAFIPVVNVFTLGRIAETKFEGKKKLPYGWILLGLQLAESLISYVSVFRFVKAVIYVIGRLSEAFTHEDALRYLFASIGTSALVSLITLVFTVLYFIALYNVYRLLAPDNAPLLLALSIIIKVSEPIVIFSLRNKPIYLGTSCDTGTLTEKEKDEV